MDYAHYQAQLAHAAGLPSLVQSGSPSAQTLAAVAGHNRTGASQGSHPSISQAVVSAAQLATVSYESMLAGSTSPALYSAGIHMSTPTAQHHMGLNNPVHHQHHSNSRKKRPKINKDGVPAPKRATTAYINFTQWYREEIKKQGRTVPRIGDFGKECAAKWNNMPEDDKAPFVQSANKDRERYKKEMAIYKPVRDVNKPKRPGTAFMLFMGDFRKEMAGREPEGGVAALAKLGGERWRGMNDDDKKPYIEKQSVEKIKYESSMEEYRRKQSVEGSLAKQARMTNAGEDDDSLSREGISGGMARPSSTESASPQTPTTPSSTDNVISQNQLQQQLQQMVSATQSSQPQQQMQNVAPTPAHSSSVALDFSAQHGATIQNFQAHSGASIQSHLSNATNTAINYSQALPQGNQQAQAQQQQPQQQPAQQQQQHAESPDDNSPGFNNGQTTAAAPNYNQAHMAGHYGWV